MSEALYERYKDALRRGHAAAAKRRNVAALDAYSEAASLAPDRALPLVGMGTVLAALDKPKDALSAFDAALDRAPGDVTALLGRAEALAAVGDSLGAGTSAAVFLPRPVPARRSFGPLTGRGSPRGGPSGHGAGSPIGRR